MNDTFRKTYTPLSEAQKEQMETIKMHAQDMLDYWNSIIETDERSERSRCMAIARTNLETTIMWAVKAITTAPTESE